MRETHRSFKPEEAPSQHPYPPLWPGFALICIGLLLRLFDLTGNELWLDEANSVIIGQSSLPELMDRLALDSSPPLFYVMLHYWQLCFGNSELALRLLSVLGGILGIGATYICASRMFSYRVGVLAAGFLAFAPAHVDYAQQVRQYTWLSLAVLLSTYCLWRLVTKTQRRHAVGYVLTTIGALMLHNHALYLLPFHGLCVLHYTWKHPKRPVALGSYLLTCLVYLPWLQHLLTQVDRMGYLSWLQRLWEELGPVGVLQVTGMAYIQGPPWTQYASVPIFPGWILAFAGLLVVCLFSVGPTLFKCLRTRALWTSDPQWVVGWCLLGPLALAFVASLLLRYPNYIPGRTDQMVYPLFLIILAHGFRNIPLPLFRNVAVFFVFLSFYVGHSFYFLYPYTQGARAASDRIVASAPTEPPVLFTSLTRASLQYYLHRKNYKGPFVSYPRHFAQHLGNHRPEVLLSEPEVLEKEAFEVLNEIDEMVSPNHSFFFVYALQPHINTASFMKSALEKDPRFTLRDDPMFFTAHREFRFLLYTVDRSERVQDDNTASPK